MRIDNGSDMVDDISLTRTDQMGGFRAALDTPTLPT